MTDLTTLANRFGTDKGTTGTNHCYTTFYESIFCDLRDKPIRLLEIGVLNGGSLAMWEAYFPEARKLIGVDVDMAHVRHSLARAELVQADAGDADQLEAIARQLGPFDIVIDDGSHEFAHQMLAVRAMMPHVVPGGWLIVEDVLEDNPTHQWFEVLMRGGGYMVDDIRAPLSLVQSMTVRERFMAAFRRLA